MHAGLKGLNVNKNIASQRLELELEVCIISKSAIIISYTEW